MAMWVLQDLLQIAHSGASGELRSSDLQLLSQPLPQWKIVEDPVSFCIPVVPSISVVSCVTGIQEAMWAAKTSDDIQSAVVAQVLLNTKRNNNWAALPFA